MTTGVDILFREKISPEPVKKYDRTRVDVNDTSSKDDSRSKISDERTFSDHLNETTAPNADSSARSDKTESTHNTSEKTDTQSSKVEDYDRPTANTLNNDENRVAEKSINESAGRRENVTSNNNTSKVSENTQPLGDTTNNNVQKIAKQNVENSLSTPVTDPVVTTVIAQKNNKEEAVKKTTSPNISVSNINVTSIPGDNDEETSSEFFAKSIKPDAKKSIENPQTVQTISIADAIPSNVIENERNVERTTNGAQEAKSASPISDIAHANITANTDAVSDGIKPNIQSGETSDKKPDVKASGQKKDIPFTNAQLTDIDHQNIQEPITAAIPTIVKNDDILETVKPTETVAIESTRILNVAPAQPQNIAANKNEGEVNKSIIKKTGKAGAAQASAGSQSQNTHNISQQANLQNNTKSDILLDLGTSGQKNDPAPLQPLTVNGQTSLSNGTMMTAQDINIHRPVATSFASALKAETPVTPKMINEQISVAVNRNIVNGQNNFSIRLHPAELGQVDIRLEIAVDGKMNASLVVENERTLSMLQRDQASLEKALQDAGVNLSGKNMNFSLMKQDQENNKQQFADLGHSSEEDFLNEDMPPLNAIQDVSMGYSNQSIDISV